MGIFWNRLDFMYAATFSRAWGGKRGCQGPVPPCPRAQGPGWRGPAHPKALHEVLEVLEGLQALGLKDAVLLQHVEHEEVHEGELGTRGGHGEDKPPPCPPKPLTRSHLYLLPRKPLSVPQEVGEKLQLPWELLQVTRLELLLQDRREEWGGQPGPLTPGDSTVPTGVPDAAGGPRGTGTLTKSGL